MPSASLRNWKKHECVKLCIMCQDLLMNGMGAEKGSAVVVGVQV